MSAGPPSPKGFRGFLKDATRSVKTIFKPRPPETGSRTPSQRSLATPPPQIIFPQGQDPAPPSQPQQIATSSRLAPSISRLPSTTSLSAPNVVQSASTGSKVSQAAKKVGADAWLGLKVGLELLEKSSDVFPPLKSAVAGFLGVVDIFEVRYLSAHVPTWRLFCSV